MKIQKQDRQRPKAKTSKTATTDPDFSAELLNVEDQDIEPALILLDPNNPRFADEDTERVPDADIPRLQDETIQHIREKIGIDDVKDKIASLGYQRHERIFVRPLKGDKKRRYVVLEGNRRVTSVKTLLDQIQREEITVPDAVADSLKQLPAVVYHGDDEDIAWLVQGLRHISAIKRWDPIQQARFIEKAARQAGAEEIEIGKRFGLSSKETVKLIDALHLFRQAKEHREYGELIDETKFAMFNEGIFDKRAALAQEFLGYDDKLNKATNDANMSRFLGLITATDANAGPKIRRAIDVRDKLPRVIAEKDLFEKLIEGELTIDRADAEAVSRIRDRQKVKFDAAQEYNRIEGIIDQVIKLPVTGISLEEQERKRFITILKKLRRIVDGHLTLLAK